jgi:hypothetical protein
MSASFKPHIRRIDKSFREDYSRSFHLTIHLSMDGLALAVYYPEKERYVGIEVYQFKDVNDDIRLAATLDQVVMNNPWLAYPFQSVTVLIDNTSTALVPAPLYEDKEKGTYLAFSQLYSDNSRIVADHLINAAAYQVYYLSNPLVEKIKDLWANARIAHYSSALIESLMIQYKNKSVDDVLFVHLRPKVFDLVVIRNEKLFFYNHFRFNTREDFIYFLLFSMEQIRMNPELARVFLLGMIDRSSPTFDIAMKYIRNVAFIEDSKSLHYSYVLDEVPHHRNYVLYHALRCEL